MWLVPLLLDVRLLTTGVESVRDVDLSTLEALIASHVDVLLLGGEDWLSKLLAHPSPSQWHAVFLLSIATTEER